MQNTEEEVKNLVRNMGYFCWDLSQKDIEKTKIGDILSVYGQDYVVVEWYYWYVKLKPIPKYRIMLDNMTSFLRLLSKIRVRW